ncbi:MAG: hypothetical protein LUD16_08050 [Lachnospiraceae bacterium]|nr:hypothetical protein [Lachnospiraceae bacterium]
MNSKNRMYLLICAMCAGLMLAGIPAAAKEEQTTEEGSEEEVSAEDSSEENDFLQELIEPNLLDELVAKYGRVSFTLTWYCADGTETYWTVYQDDTYYVDDDIDELQIDTANDVYGIDYEADTIYRYLFIGEDCEPFIEGMEAASLFTYNEGEEIVSREVSDGMIYLETVVYYTDDYTTEDLIDCGYDGEEYEYEIADYVIDEETYEILELRTYAVSGEKKTLFTEAVLDKEPEEFVPDEEITEVVFGEGSSFTVITDAGTDEETAYTQTISASGSILVMCGDEFDDYLYADPECTEVLEDFTGYDAVYLMYDTVYLKRVDEE